MRARSRGLSLVELMVAVTISLVTVIVIMQVLTVYESRKRTATYSNDAEISASVGLFMMEREIRMAGAGLTLPSGFACGPGTNIFHDAATFLDGEPRAPLRIVDGGAAPDRIEVFRGNADFGPAPSTIVQNMASPDSLITVSGNLALQAGDLVLVTSPDGSKRCTMMQLSEDPEPTGNAWRIHHDADAQFPYNPADADAAFTNAVSYEVSDVIVNLGRFGIRAFGVVCNDDGAPAADNSCDLAGWDAIAAPANPTLADVDSIAPQVVNLQAQYGVAPLNSQTVNEWVDATGGTWADPTAANQARIKAVRIAIVTRGNLEREMVSPATLVLWDEGQPTEATMDLDDEARRYRYKVLRVVIPLINVIWAGV